VVGAVVGAVVFAVVVTGALVFAVAGAVEAFVVAFVVVTVVAADDVATSGSGTFVADDTVGAPVAPSAAPETGKIMPPARATMSRLVTSRRAPRILERCIHTIGEVGS
jgi:hypothetical protein